MKPAPVDLLISPEWIIPVVPECAVFSGCSVAICDGRIRAVLPTADARRQFAPARELKLPNQVLIPGLINCHGHAAMSLLRGYADDLPLQSWLQDSIWPAESRWVSGEFVRDGSELAMAEMLLRGTTCFSDMYFYPDQVAAVARKIGMRCQIAFPVLEFPTAWARDADEYLHKGLALFDEYRGDPFVKPVFGPHAPYTVNDPHLERIAVLAEELDTGVHIHLHETAQEVSDALRDTGVRPIQRLERLGLMNVSTQCVHMTQVDGTDLEILNRTNAQVIHCPKSNLKLASGFCPVATLLQSGINVALGTDGAASNNSLDLFDEMRFAALLAKAVSNDAAAVDAHQALRLATLNGARALNIEATTGSIEVGKSADLVAVALAAVEAQPLYNPLSQLVYTASGNRVTHVWIAGHCQVADGELQTIHMPEILAKAAAWRLRISGQGTASSK